MDWSVNNKKVYSGSSSVIKWYDKLSGLLPTEEILFNKFKPLIEGKKILDIGIGGGRTAPALIALSAHYTGIDYAKKFADLVSRKFPQQDIRHMDARDMSTFQDESFDFVFFALNGIDSVNHQDRHEILKEIHRVLKPKGCFLFSAHNRDYKYFGKHIWQRAWRFSPGFVKDCVMMLLSLPKHWKMKKHEVHHEDYAVINDEAHYYSLLNYYITPAKQLEQLNQHHFKNVQCFDFKGLSVSENVDDPWLYYLAEKQSSRG